MTVSVRGFLPNRKFYLSECLTPNELNALGCGAQLAAQPFDLTDAHGNGSTSSRSVPQRAQDPSFRWWRLARVSA